MSRRVEGRSTHESELGRPSAGVRIRERLTSVAIGRDGLLAVLGGVDHDRLPAVPNGRCRVCRPFQQWFDLDFQCRSRACFGKRQVPT